MTDFLGGGQGGKGQVRIREKDPNVKLDFCLEAVFISFPRGFSVSIFEL